MPSSAEAGVRRLITMSLGSEIGKKDAAKMMRAHGPKILYPFSVLTSRRPWAASHESATEKADAWISQPNPGGMVVAHHLEHLPYAAISGRKEKVRLFAGIALKSMKRQEKIPTLRKAGPLYVGSAFTRSALMEIKRNPAKFIRAVQELRHAHSRWKEDLQPAQNRSATMWTTKPRKRRAK